MSVAVRGDHLQFTTLHLEAQGNVLAVAHKMRRVSPPPGGRRGIVTGFSPASRKRMMRKVARLDADNATFLTLTYPARYPAPMEAKAHLRALLERFRRRYPDASALWRLEAQQRGAPHFHLLFFNLPFVPFHVVRFWWGQITADYIDQHKPRVRIERVKSKAGAMRYCAKYTAKREDHSFFINGAYLHAVGRVWGVWNGHKLPFARQQYAIIEQIDFTALPRILTIMQSCWDGVDPTWPHGVCVFTDHATVLFPVLLALAVDNKTHGSTINYKDTDSDERILHHNTENVRVHRLSIRASRGFRHTSRLVYFSGDRLV